MSVPSSITETAPTIGHSPVNKLGDCGEKELPPGQQQASAVPQ